MKKNIIVGIIGVVVVVALLFGFKALINRSEDRESIENKKDETASALDLERVYPKTPEEVVNKFAQINKYTYRNDLSEEEMEEVVENLRMLYDQELLEQNTEDVQISAFINELFQADSVNRKLMNYEVYGDEKVEYKENKYGELALVNATFYFKQDDAYPKAEYTFILRKDANGNWKILGWDYADNFNKNQEDEVSEK